MTLSGVLKRTLLALSLCCAIVGKAEASRVHSGIIAAVTPYLPAQYVPLVDAMNTCVKDEGILAFEAAIRAQIPPGSNFVFELNYQLDSYGIFCHMTTIAGPLTNSISINGNGSTMIQTVNGSTFIYTFALTNPAIGEPTLVHISQVGGDSGWFHFIDGFFYPWEEVDECKDMYGSVQTTNCP